MLFPGAPPVTSIDGDRLIGLLIQHEVGIQKKPVHIFELDETYLAAEDPEGEAADALASTHAAVFASTRT